MIIPHLGDLCQERPGRLMNLAGTAPGSAKDSPRFAKDYRKDDEIADFVGQFRRFRHSISPILSDEEPLTEKQATDSPDAEGKIWASARQIPAGSGNIHQSLDGLLHIMSDYSRGKSTTIYNVQQLGLNRLYPSYL